MNKQTLIGFLVESSDEKPKHKTKDDKYINAKTSTVKAKYATTCYKLLKRSYKAVGGIKGIHSANHMIEKYPLWKVMVFKGKAIAVILYDSTGSKRKIIAFGTDGSDDAKRMLRHILYQEFERTYFEVTSHLYTYIHKHFKQMSEKYVHSSTQAGKILGVTVDDIDGTRYSRMVDDRTIKRVLIGKKK